MFSITKKLWKEQMFPEKGSGVGPFGFLAMPFTIIADIVVDTKNAVLDLVDYAVEKYTFRSGASASSQTAVKQDVKAPSVEVVQARGHGKAQAITQDVPISDKTVDMMEKAQKRAIALGGEKLGVMVSREFNAHEPEKLNAMAEKASDPALGKGSRDRFITSLLKRKQEYSAEDIGIIKKTPFKDKVMAILRGRQVQTAVAKTESLAGAAAGFAASAEKLHEQTRGKKGKRERG